MPCAYLPSTAAVAGATITRSACWPRWVCGIGSGPVPPHRQPLKRLVRAGSDARAEKVSAPTNSSAPAVSTGETNAPASTSRRQTSTAL